MSLCAATTAPNVPPRLHLFETPVNQPTNRNTALRKSADESESPRK
jgi:hypothetical protein